MTFVLGWLIQQWRSQVVKRQPAGTWQRTYSVKGMRTPKVSKKTGFGFGPFLKEKIEEKGRAVLS